MTNETCPDRVHCDNYNRLGRCDGCGHAYIDYNFLTDNPIQKAIDKWMAEPLPKAAYVGVGRSNGKTDVLDALKYAMEPLSKLSVRPDITNVKFNPPATIVFWSDKTKTVVKAQDDEPFDPEKGLAMAMVKKYLGNKGSYFNVISKWVDKYVDPKDPLGVEKAMNDAGKSASAVSECVDKIRRIFNVPQEITFEGTISDTDAIKEILGYGPGKFAITFDAVKVEEPSTITPMDMFVETGADLIELIECVKSDIETDGYITLESYYFYGGYEVTDDPQNEKYNVSKYGWTEVPTFGTTFDEDGFLLKAPEAKLLEVNK